MKKLFTLLFLVAATATQLTAGVVQSGVYRIVCAGNDLVVTEDGLTGKLYCGDNGGDKYYNQLWRLTDKGGDKYTFQNVLTDLYIQADGSGQFYTGTAEAQLFITQNAYVSSFLNVSTGSNSGFWNSQGGTANLVTWSACTGDSDGENNRSAWKMVSVPVDESLVAAAKQDFATMKDCVQNASTYAANARKYFTDDSGEELAAPYASMDENQLRSTVTDLPKELVDYMVRLAKDQWVSKWEKSFRFGSYKAYGDPSYWANVMNNSIHGQLTNPTGIRVDNGQVLYIFVGDDIPANSSLEIELLAGTDGVVGTRTTLRKGLNIVSAGRMDQAVFVRYIAKTRLDNKLVLADFPEIRINVQGGTLNGYYDVTKHSNADWEEMRNDPNLFSGFSIQVKGRHVLWNMNSQLVRQCVPDHMVESISVWDSIQVWESRQMGLEECVPAKHDFVLNCVSVTYNYMFAFGNGTAYNENTLSSILYYKNYENGGGAYWGPAHETGHNNQNLITFPGGTEVSNNLFSNIVCYSAGKATSRGVGVRDGVCKNFGTSWFDRDIWEQTRMYYQLYLYFYELGKDKEFYPTLYKALRADPMTNHSASTVRGVNSWIKFALKCCQIANADLSEFFDSYGFFEPCSSRFVGDYANSYVTLTQAEADAAKAQMQRYEKKLGNLVFVEDRIYPAKGRAPWGDPAVDRIDYSSEFPLGKMGDVGQYLDYEDETLVPTGYKYTRKNQTITISHTDAKGAVGFKVYDADGRLAAISNTYTFMLPATLTGQKVTIVAAAPVANNDAVIPSTAEAGTEEEQLAALTSVLNTTRGYLALSDGTGTYVGWFLPSSLEELQALYDAAAAARQNNDQSQHTYGEWALLLDDAVAALLAKDDACVPLYKDNYYALYPSTYSNYNINALANGALKCSINSAPEKAPNRQWQFVPAAVDGAYYLYNVGAAAYITYCEKGKQLKAESANVAEAVPFTLTEYTTGKFLIQPLDATYYIYCGSDKSVTTSTSAGEALWLLTSVVDNRSTLIKGHAAELLSQATAVVAEVAATTDPVTFNDNVIPEAGNLGELVSQLLAASDALGALVADENATLEALEAASATVDAALAAVTAAYTLRATLPAAEQGDIVTCYYLQNLTTDGYCYFNDSGTRKGTLRTSELEDPDDQNYWFYFRPGTADGTFVVWSWAASQPIYHSSGYLYADGKKDPVSYAMTLTSDQTGIVISTADGLWSVQTSSSAYAQFRSTDTASAWKLIPIGKYDATAISTPLQQPQGDDAIYDLSGRRVLDPAPGIYVMGGRKILIR